MQTPLALAALFAVFIALSWVLALAESAFTYVSRRDAEEVVRERPQSRILEVVDDRDTHLASLRLWRFVAQALAAVCLTGALVWVLDDGWAVVVAALVLVAVAAALGVWSPRPIGSRNEAAVARRTASLVRGLRRAAGPVASRLGRDRHRREDEAAEEDDFEERHLREVVARAHEADVLDDSEAELIESVFSMTDTLVRSVMVPRTDVVTIDHAHTLGQAMDLFLRSGCSRVPVIGEDADDVRGMLHLKDVTRALHQEGAAEQDPLAATMREARFVPESKSVGALLQELQRESTHVAVVVDEYGGTAGLVTLEDLIEEIVGEIYDEDDLPERPEVEPLGPGVFSVDARMGIGDFREEFDLPEPEEEDDDVDTVGGLLAKELGRVPIRGSRVTVQGIELIADSLEPRRNRVARLRVVETAERPPRVRRREEETPAAGLPSVHGAPSHGPSSHGAAPQGPQPHGSSAAPDASAPADPNRRAPA